MGHLLEGLHVRRFVALEASQVVSLDEVAELLRAAAHDHNLKSESCQLELDIRKAAGDGGLAQ